MPLAGCQGISGMLGRAAGRHGIQDRVVQGAAWQPWKVQELSLWVWGGVRGHGKILREEPPNCSPHFADSTAFSQGEFCLFQQILKVIQDAQPRKKRGRKRIQYFSKIRWNAKPIFACQTFLIRQMFWNNWPSLVWNNQDSLFTSKRCAPILLVYSLSFCQVKLSVFLFLYLFVVSHQTYSVRPWTFHLLVIFPSFDEAFPDLSLLLCIEGARMSDLGPRPQGCHLSAAPTSALPGISKEGLTGHSQIAESLTAWYCPLMQKLSVLLPYIFPVGICGFFFFNPNHLWSLLSHISNLNPILDFMLNIYINIIHTYDATPICQKHSAMGHCNSHHEA